MKTPPRAATKPQDPEAADFAWVNKLTAKYAARPPANAQNTNQLAAAMGVGPRTALLRLDNAVAAGKLQCGVFGKHKYYWPAAK
jgi:hypothetical protein